MPTNLETQIKITAKDETKVAFNSVGVSMKGLAGAAGQLGKVLGGAALAGGAALGVFLVDAAKGAAEAQVSLAKVEATLKTMGDAALKNKDALLEHAQSAVKLGFDDEAAAESIAKLYQRTGDLTKANELNNLAMDLARSKSIDLGTASTLVGQVLSGNGKVLKQYGIDIADSATPLQALGQLHEKVAGQSQAFASTFSGQMLSLQESVSNLKDTVGTALLEALQPFVGQLVEFANDPKTVAQVKAIATSIGNFATVALPVAIEAVKILYSWFQNVVWVLTTFGDSLLFAIDLIYQMVAALAKLASSSFGAVFNGVKSAGSAIGGGLTNFGHALSFDSGGIVPGPIGAPQMALVHGGETIFPTHKQSGGFGTTINIINPTLLDDTMVSKLSDKIAELLRQDFRY